MKRWTCQLRATTALSLLTMLGLQLIRPVAAVAAPTADSVAPAASSASKLLDFVEDVAQRTSHRKVFRKGDTTKVLLSAVPINMETKPGVWSEIDNTLVPDEGAFALRNKLNHFYVHFTDKITGNQIRFEHKDRAVTFELDEQRLGAGPVVMKARGNNVQYTVPGGHARLEYELGGSGLLENIWLDKATAATEYQFTLTTEGVTPQAQEDGSIWFVYNDSVTERAFYIPPPFAEDADGVQTGVSQQVEAMADGRWRLRVSLARAWLSAPERSFPVRIDPVLLADLDGGQWVELNSANTTWSDQKYISVSGTTRTGHMQFDLRDLMKNEGSKLSHADLHISIKQGTGCDQNCGGTMLLAQENQEWFKAIASWTQPRWKTGPTWQGGDACSAPSCVAPLTLAFADNFQAGQLTSGGVTGPWYYDRWFDVTTMVHGWLDGSVPNNGFLLYNSNKAIKMVSPTFQCCTTSESGLELFFTAAGAPTVTLDATDPLRPSATVATDAALIKTELYVDGVLAGTVASKTSGTFSFAVDPKRLPFGSHMLIARAYTIAGQVVDSPAAVGTFGDGGVTPPVNLNVYPTAGGGMRLTWARASASNPNSSLTYTVSRSSDSAFTSPVTVTTGLTTTNYIDSTAGGTLYYYRVQAVTSSGVASLPTSPAQSVPPIKPFGLHYHGTAAGGIQLNWAASPTAQDDPGIRYNVYRGAALISSGVTTTRYTDSSTTVGGRYSYYVVSVNQQGQTSPGSDTLTATAFGTYAGPDAPELARALPGRGQSAILTWSPADDATVTYDVIRYAGNDPYVDLSGSQPRVQGLTASTWTDTALAEGTRYWYRVRTVKNGTAGPWTDPTGTIAAVTPHVGADGRQAFQSEQWGSHAAAVNLASGNLVVSTVDSAISMPYLSQVVARTYNSQATDKSAAALGTGWRLNAEWRVEQTADGAAVIEGDGTEHRFTLGQSGYVAESRYYGNLQRNNTTGTWSLVFSDLVNYQFDSAGKLTQVQEQNGNQLNYQYTSGHLTHIASYPVPRSVQLTYDATTGRLQRITDSAGRVTSYSYNDHGLLAQVTDNANAPTRYYYDQLDRLVRVEDAAGRWNYVVYGLDGAAEYIVDGLGNTTFIAMTAAPAGETVVIDPAGNRSRYTLNNQGWLTSVTDPLGAQTSLGYAFSGAKLDTFTVTNPRGLVTTYAFDAAGHITQVVDSAAATADTQDLAAPGQSTRTNTAAYDSNTGALLDQASQVTANATHGSTHSYTYAASASFPYRLSGATIQRYTLPASGTRTNVGAPVRYTFSASDLQPGWITAAFDPNGYETDFTYNAEGTISTVTKRNVDADLVSAAVPVTSRDLIQEFTYNADGQLRDATDWHQAGSSNLAVAHTDYDAVGRPVLVVAPDGARTYTMYDPSGIPLLTVDNGGRVQVLTRDRARRTTDVIAADGGTNHFDYDAAGRNTRVSDPLNHATAITYDALNRVSRVTDPNGMAQAWTYDAVGNITAITTGSAAILDQGQGYRITANYYLGNLLRSSKELLPTAAITVPAGTTLPPTDPGDPIGTTYNITSYQYNLIGQPVDMQDGNGNHMGYAHDDADQLSSVTQFMTGGNLVTTYGYDYNGNLVSVTDARQKASRSRYDGFNRLWRQIDATGVAFVEYRFDDAGNMSQKIEPRQIDTVKFTGTITYEYDQAHRLIHTVFQRPVPTNTSYDPITPNRRYAYDGSGRRVFMWDGTGARLYGYDDMGRLQEERGVGQLVTYAYDKASRLTAMNSHLGLTSYSYDDGNRTRSVTDPFGNTSTYTYDANYGALANLQLPLASPNTITRRDTYYQLSDGRLTSRLKQRIYTKTISGTSSQVWQGTYTYDLVGNVRTFTDSTPLNQTYTYDQAYRLIQANGASGNNSHPNSRYRYDAGGNRTTWGNEETSGTVYNYVGTARWQTTQTVDDANRVTRVDEVFSSTKKIQKNFQYEPNGNLRSERWVRTGYTDVCNAGLTGMFGATKYDDAGLLVDREEEDGQRTTNRENVTSYEYDGDGRRVTQLYQQIDYTAGATSCTAKPVWSEPTAYEYANGEVLNERTAGDVPVWYIRDPHGALLYTLHWRVNELKPDVYVQDRLDSIRMVVDYQGAVANKYQYDAYGSITSSSSTLRNSYTFTGYGLDVRTGLYHAQARYYRPELGRFMSQDTWRGSAWAPWTQNLYAYVGNNPVNMVDPTGHMGIQIYDGGGGGGDPTVAASFIDQQGNTINTLSNGRTTVECWDGSTKIPCRDRFASQNSVPAGYQYAVTGQGVPRYEAPPAPDFYTAGVGGGPLNVSGTVDREGHVYASGSRLAVDAAPSISGLAGWIIGDDKDPTTFVAGEGSTWTASVFYVTFGNTSSGSRHAFLFGLNSELFDFSYSEGHTDRWR